MSRKKKRKIPRRMADGRMARRQILPTTSSLQTSLLPAALLRAVLDFADDQIRGLDRSPICTEDH
ncbi:hypothetical protein PIB30_051485, partial [Stylosanthes scabra]|nr:hypothetical protein [Stylosanthes scabra]